MRGEQPAAGCVNLDGCVSSNTEEDRRVGGDRHDRPYWCNEVLADRERHCYLERDHDR